MKRFAIILLAVATALVMALPATAKKPAPGPEPPATYLAEIVYTEGNGIGTTCATGLIEVTRIDERGGRVIHFESEGATLQIDADGLAFGGESIEGCDGTAAFPEYFRITLDGDEVAMLWIFDVEVTQEPVVLRNGKVRYQEVRTDFRMGGPYDGGDFAAWGHSEDNGTITTGGTGTFSFVQYDSSRDPLFVPLTNGTPVFSLEITLTPAPGS